MCGSAELADASAERLARPARFALSPPPATHHVSWYTCDRNSGKETYAQCQNREQRPSHIRTSPSSSSQYGTLITITARLVIESRSSQQ